RDRGRGDGGSPGGVGDGDRVGGRGARTGLVRTWRSGQATGPLVGVWTRAVVHHHAHVPAGAGADGVTDRGDVQAAGGPHVHRGLRGGRAARGVGHGDRVCGRGGRAHGMGPRTRGDTT